HGRSRLSSTRAPSVHSDSAYAARSAAVPPRRRGGRFQRSFTSPSLPDPTMVSFRCRCVMPSTKLCLLAFRRQIIPKHLQNPRLLLGFSARRDVDRGGHLWDKGARE